MEFEHDQKRKGEVQSTGLGSRYPGSRTRTPLPLLDTQTPTHLDNMGFLVIRVRFLHCLGAGGENVLEKTPVWSTPQEILAHGHERGKICDGVGRKMMELDPEEIQEAPKKRVQRK